MIKWIIIAILLVLIIFLWQNKIVFRIDTIFRKGFKKVDDSFGVYCWVRKATVTVRHIVLLIGLVKSQNMVKRKSSLM